MLYASTDIYGSDLMLFYLSPYITFVQYFFNVFPSHTEGKNARACVSASKQ